MCAGKFGVFVYLVLRFVRYTVESPRRLSSGVVPSQPNGRISVSPFAVCRSSFDISPFSAPLRRRAPLPARASEMLIIIAAGESAMREFPSGGECELACAAAGRPVIFLDAFPPLTTGLRRGVVVSGVRQ